MLTKSYDLELKADDITEDGVFEGLGSTFGNIDSMGDVITDGAFGTVNASRIAMLYQHDMRQPIGVWDEIVETRRGLEVKGRLAMASSQGRDVYELMKFGALKSMSIGFNIPSPAKNARPDNSRTWTTPWGDKRPVRNISKVNLLEISVVTIPANPKAKISRVKSDDGSLELPTERELEHYLQDDCGLSRREAMTLLSKGYSALASERDADAVGDDAERDAGSNEQSAADALKAMIATDIAKARLKISLT